MIVLDSSAILAEFGGEPGGAIVTAAYPDVVLSAVNFVEVVSKLVDRGLDEDAIGEIVDDMRCEIIAQDREQALLAGKLRAVTRSLGLSLGDRACLALALVRGASEVLTTDRAWLRVDLGLRIRLIR